MLFNHPHLHYLQCPAVDREQADILKVTWFGEQLADIGSWCDFVPVNSSVVVAQVSWS